MSDNKKTSYRILRTIKLAIIGIIIGFGAGFVIGKIIKPMIYADISSADVALTLFLALVFFVLSFIIHIVVHEAGHMIAAMARGWKFLSFMIMGVVLNRRNGRLRLSRFSMAGAAGQCLMLPPENGDTPFGIALYNAGGVLANLLLTVVASVILFMPSTHHSLTAIVFLLCVIIVGLYLIIMNGIPHKLAGLPNDGLNMLSLRNDKFATMVFLRSMRLIGYLMQDDTSRLEAMTYMYDDRDINFSNPIHVMALSSDLSLAMLRMDFGKANAIMQRAELHISRMITIYRNELTLERIYLTLIRPHYPDDINRLLDKSISKYLQVQSVFRPSALRVQYALAAIHEADSNKAEKIYERFQRVSRKYYLQGEIKYEQQLVDFVRSGRYKNIE
ncbi:putative uncharacterized protein [Prevotella sp. CAG:1185]|nr:putative uncharacterized protein [Prevotella sp. CAG:1185]